jgi:uncharacterized membrane protein YjgN (DUF898 family)
VTDLTATPPSALLTARDEHPVVTAGLGALFRIFYVNLILTILTLGIYRFWAKTRLRRYIWRHVSVGGESFAYTGTGKELLIGFLKALVVLLPPLVIIGIVEIILDNPWDSIVGGLKYIAVLIVFTAGTYAARRYRMSRTTWSGIRFHQAGSPWRYAGLYIKGSVLTAITLGLYVPYFRTQLTAYETTNLYLGSEPFRFTGVGRDLFKRWLIAWLLAVPTLFLSLLWYRAVEYRYYAAHTQLAEIKVAMSVRGRDLFVFYLVNILILVVSLGILFPVLIRRRVTFWSRWLTFDGAIDLAMIRQADRGPPSGEGLANFFDMDFLGV